VNRSAKSSRKPTRLSGSIHQQLNRYALAASAAGVGVLATAHPATAKIVYTPTNVSIQGSVPLDLDHNGVIDFYLWHSDTNNGSTVASFMAVYPNPAGCGAIGTAQGGFRDAVALKRGARITDDALFNVAIGDLAVHGKRSGTHTSTYWKGQWGNGGAGLKNRYLGLKFQINGKTHFGWARISVTTSPGNFGFTVKLTGYAYETIPNKRILAGQTKGPAEIKVIPEASLSVPNPQPATLGLLARGSAGLPIWRREQ
jgi:hypothetical protein